MSKTIQKICEWLEAQGRANPYSEAGIRIVFHAGEIKRVERTVVEKMKPNAEGGV